MVFTIIGTDHYQVAQKLRELKKSFSQKRDKAGLNFVALDGEKIILSQLQQEALTAPFLGERKMIVIKNVLANKKNSAEIVDFLKNNQERIDNIICFVDFIDPEKNKVNKQNKLSLAGDLFKFLSKGEYFWELNLMKGRQLETWLKKYTDQESLKIELDAATELIIRAGNNLFQITSELRKLSAFKKEGIITSDDIKNIVSPKFDDNIFSLVDALGNQDQKTALQLVNSQLNFGTHPLMIISMIARQFKLILQVNDPKSSPAKLKIHPYVADKIKKQSQNFTANQLIKIANEILNMEKSLKSGEKNPALLLNLFITKNC